MLTICCLGSRALNSGVPFRSEKSVSQVQHRTNRMSSDFPIQRVNLTFPRPRRPESGHLELTQHRSETSTGIAPSRPTARGPRTSAPSFRTHQTAKTLNYSRSRSILAMRPNLQREAVDETILPRQDSRHRRL